MQETVNEIKAKLENLLVSVVTETSTEVQREKLAYISEGLDGLIEAFDEAYPVEK